MATLAREGRSLLPACSIHPRADVLEDPRRCARLALHALSIPRLDPEQ
jgi:hypothetical protein